MKKLRNNRRIIILFTVFYFIFGILTVRVAVIQNSEIAEVADFQFTKGINIGKTRGYIYDRNLVPLVNTSIENFSAILINDETKNLVTEQISDMMNGLILTVKTDNLNESKYIKNFEKVGRYSDNGLCVHLVGYVNAENKGVSGIEKAFDKILNDASGELKLCYEADASGIALQGDGLSLIEESYNSSAGLSLTIDSEIQKIIEEVLDNSQIDCGSVVVMSVNDFEILACASKPEFSQNNVALSLENNELPFLNRALSAYPVGSVFKPIVVAAALENNIDINELYECKGVMTINSNSFGCYSKAAHGLCDLNSAIEKSCNTYFINVGLKTGKENLIKTAENLGFGKEITFCSTLSSDKGNLPDSESIKSDSQLATLCFGQGELLATPVQLTAAYCVFASNGIYKEPTILKELLDENMNSYGYYKSEICYKALTQETCEIINNCLYNNMLNGTGKKGAPENTTSAGKTATAQTGRYDDEGNEILCTWFSGFFPFENPEYVVTVFNENGSTASEDCAPVFKEIAEKIIIYQDALQGF